MTSDEMSRESNEAFYAGERALLVTMVAAWLFTEAKSRQDLTAAFLMLGVVVAWGPQIVTRFVCAWVWSRKADRIRASEVARQS